MKSKNVYNPEVLDLYLLDKKKVVTAYYNVGHIVCQDWNSEAYVTDWASGYFESKRLKKIGILIRPRWDHYEMKWVKIRVQNRRKIGE